MFDDEDGAVRLQKTRTMTVSYDADIDDLVRVICDAIPELNQNSFITKVKKGKSEFRQVKARKLLNQKVALHLKIQKISDDKYHITYEYSTRFFRPFLFLFVCIGLLFGLVPGLIIYYMFHESDTTEVQKVTPLLDRFESLVGSALQGEDQNEVLSVKSNVNKSSEENDPDIDIVGQLEKLTALKDSGAIDDKEFQQLKSKFMS